MSLPPRVAIGIDDFRKLRELQLEYVDKSDLIRQLLDRAGVEAVLLPRPRRFGKSLNLSMLRCFFEKRDEGALWSLLVFSGYLKAVEEAPTPWAGLPTRSPSPTWKSATSTRRPSDGG